MRLNTTVCVSLCLPTIFGCSSVPKPEPQIIRILEYVPLPAACARLQVVQLPAGTTAQGVIEAQHAAILAYEKQVSECAAGE